MIDRRLGCLLLQVIVVHALNGHEVVVNMRTMTNFGPPGGTMTDAVECVIHLIDGKFVSTKETCDEVGALMAKAPTGGYLDSR